MGRPSKEPSVWTKKISFGKISSDTKPTKMIVGYIALGILMITIPVVAILGIGIGIGFEDFLEESFFPMLLILSPSIGFGVWFLTAPGKIKKEYDEFMIFVEKEHKKEKLEYERWEKEHPHWEAEEFYRQLREAGFTSADTDTKKEKLRLYVKSNDIKYEKGKNIVDYFNLGKSEVERIEKKARISALKVKEKAKEKELLKYASLVGREKSTKYCRDMIANCKKNIEQCKADEETVKRGGEATYSLGKQKEHDWAIHGGIASGIAGGAAGVATAINIQNKNAEIRENNQKLAKATAELMLFQLQRIWDVKNREEDSLKYWQERLNEYKIKLVRKEDPEILMEKLQIRVKNYNVSESGAVELKVGCKCKEQMHINELNASVDGSINVVIKYKDKVLGNAVCVLQFGGVSTHESSIEAICPGANACGKDLTFDFEPVSLWLIEE